MYKDVLGGVYIKLLIKSSGVNMTLKFSRIRFYQYVFVNRICNRIMSCHCNYIIFCTFKNKSIRVVNIKQIRSVCLEGKINTSVQVSNFFLLLITFKIVSARSYSGSCVLTVERYLTRERGCVCKTQVIPTGSTTATGGQFTGYHLQSLQANFITSAATISTHDNVLLDQRR